MSSLVSIRCGAVVVAVSGRDLGLDILPSTERVVHAGAPVAACDHEHRVVDAMFDMLGGNAEIARFLDVGTSTVSEMRRRASIPAKYFCSFERMATAKGVQKFVNVVTLAAMHDVFSSSVTDDTPNTGAPLP